MFFGKHLLSNKEPLGVLWLAGTLGKSCKKLSKKKILLADIPQLANRIINNKKKKKDVVVNNEGEEEVIALRVTGTLLLGVVVIYNRKIQYLLSEANQMIQRVKQLQFKVHHSELDFAAVNMQKNGAKFETITLPHSDDIDLLLMTNLNSALIDESILNQWNLLSGVNPITGQVDHYTNLLSYQTIDGNTFEATETETISGGLNISNKRGKLNDSMDIVVSNEEDMDLDSRRKRSSMHRRITSFLMDDEFNIGLNILNDGEVKDNNIEKNEEVLGGIEGFEEIGGLGQLETNNIQEQQEGLNFQQDREEEKALDEINETNLKKRKRREQHLIIDDEIQLNSEHMKNMIEDYSSLIIQRPKYTNPKTEQLTDTERYFKGMNDEEFLFANKYEKGIIERLFEERPCGYNARDEAFNNQFSIWMRQALEGRQLYEELQEVGDIVEVGGIEVDQEHQVVQEEVEERSVKKRKGTLEDDLLNDESSVTLQERNINANLFLEEFGGLDNNNFIEQPRSLEEERGEEPIDELTAILLTNDNNEDSNAFITASLEELMAINIPKEVDSQEIPQRDEFVEFLEELADNEQDNNDAVKTPLKRKSLNNKTPSSMVKKSWKVLSYIKRKANELKKITPSQPLQFDNQIEFSFSQLIKDGEIKSNNKNKRRKEKAAQAFYQVLVLASNGFIQVNKDLNHLRVIL
ncbi:hypothetical protein ABK040_001740 [Willaertia magna]